MSQIKLSLIVKILIYRIEVVEVMNLSSTLMAESQS
jgi:hypothetical protein